MAFTARTAVYRKAKQVPKQDAEAEARKTWASPIRRIAGTGRKAKEAPDLARARAAFAALSEAMAEAMNQFGHAEEEPRPASRPSKGSGVLALWLQAGLAAEGSYVGPTASHPIRAGSGSMANACRTRSRFLDLIVKVSERSPIRGLAAGY